MINFLASYDKKVDKVVMKNSPQNAISLSIQKEISHVFARMTQNEIREEIEDNFFFVYLMMKLVMESTREQMTLIVKFVAKNTYVKERFLDIIYLQNTISFTLSKGFIEHCLTIILTFNMFEVKDMMELVICVVS
jgi:hypothetical protein